MGSLRDSLDSASQQIADLKRKLSDSIAREQEIERELAGCRSDVSTFRQQATNLRAHAEALAEELEKLYYRAEDSVDFEKREEAWTVLTAYRNREE